MSVPPLLEDLMQRLEALALRDGSSALGPLRVEWTFEGLADLPIAELGAAAFLGLEGAVRAGDSDLLLGLLHAPRGGRELWLDPHFEDLPSESLWPTKVAARCARVSVDLSLASAPSFRACQDFVARHPQALVRFRFRGTTDLREVLAWWTDGVPPEGGVMKVEIDAPTGSPGVHDLEALAEVARATGTALRIGRRLLVAPPRAAHEAPAILQEALRTAFSEFPELCPFPFVTSRAVQGDLAVRAACAEPEGPRWPAAEGFSGPTARALRRAFHEGQESAGCPGCARRAEVRRALAEHAVERGTQGFTV